MLPDINECQLNDHGCSDTCENSVGSFSCTCPEGHILMHDMKTCEGINFIDLF